MKSTPCSHSTPSLWSSLAIAIGIGSAMGVALDDYAMGISVGIGIGLAFGGGVYLKCRAAKRGDDAPDGNK